MKLKRFLLSGTMRVIYFLLLSVMLTTMWLYLIEGACKLLFKWSFIDYLNMNDWALILFAIIVYGSMSVFSMAFVGIVCSRFKKS